MHGHTAGLSSLAGPTSLACLTGRSPYAEPLPAMPESPATPSFWNTRYEKDRTPWDCGGVPPPLCRYLAARPGHGASVLIPGCGSGYEIGAFLDAGYRVAAIDFSPPAVARARARFGPRVSECLVEGDFFTHDLALAPFDLVYERTFVCALPPDWWPKIVRRTAELLKPGGSWIGVFVFGPKDDGPPFGFEPAEASALMDPFFITVADQPVPAAESLPLFAGQERWQERHRRGQAVPPARA